jgi:beta-aspartyl-peptidase (threonine type)
MLGESKKANPVTAGGVDLLPMGYEANRPTLEQIIEFALEQGLKPVPNSHFATERRRHELERMLQGQVDAGRESLMGTVGAVALDAAGNLAAATSTGGTQDKAPGRLGDTPIVGAGTFADDRLGAASCTGWGEPILRVVLAKTAVDALSGRRSPLTAGRAALKALERIRGRGGVILVDRTGRAAAAFNTPRMARGVYTERAGLAVAVERGERRR